MSRYAATRDGRVGKRWRIVSAEVYRTETHCWLCGGWVDMGLPSTHPYSRTADHLRQLCHGGRTVDRANLRLAHRACNTARSNTLRNLSVRQCLCSVGMPCGVLEPERRRGFVSVDVETI